jgi:hypothetical protein
MKVETLAENFGVKIFEFDTFTGEPLKDGALNIAVNDKDGVSNTTRVFQVSHNQAQELFRQLAARAVIK